MRQIKFRAFYENREGIRVLQYTEPNHKVDIDNSEWRRVTNWEQFTGLHDKNGKEIYEGDIVSYESGMWTKHKQDVKYSNGYFIPLVRVEEGYNAIDDYYSENFEIIGNIHEDEQ